MNILVISSKYAPEYAGSAIVAHRLYKGLNSKYGIKFGVLTSSITFNSNCTYFTDDVRVYRIAKKLIKPLTYRNDLQGLSYIFNILRFSFQRLLIYWIEAVPTFIYLIKNFNKFDLFHIYGNVTVTSVAITFAKITGKPIIIELQNMVYNPHQYEPSLFSIFLKKGFPKQALIVCISEHLVNLCKANGYSQHQIWNRPNPVDENRFYFEVSAKIKYRRKLQLFDSSDIIILHLAKFIPRKKQLFMVELLPYLPDYYKLILAGPKIDSGPLFERDQTYYQTILDAVRDHNLEKRVRFIPRFLERPEDYIKASDIFVLPSIMEGLGTTFLEALACGVPVVTNDIPGVFDKWIKPGKNGFICSLNHSEWAEIIQQAAGIDKHSMKLASEEVLSRISLERTVIQTFRRLEVLTKRAKS